MTKIPPRKPFYGLAELCDRWSLSESDIAAYVLEDELTLSVAVGGVRVETSEVEPDDRGGAFRIPTGTRWIVGTMDVSRIDAWSVLQNGSHAIGRFYSAEGELLDLPEKDGEQSVMLVDRQSLVVRRTEVERFQDAQGLGPDVPAAEQATGARSREKSRGAPVKYDWEGALCEVIVIVNDEGVPETQAELIGKVRDWFARTVGPDNVPSDTSIKTRVSRFWDRIKPSVGRPSALRNIHEPVVSRSGEKSRRAKP